MARNSFSRLLFTNRQAHTALASFTSEASLIAAAANFDQPVWPSGLFAGPDAIGRSYRIEAAGVLSSTGTPTYTFQYRLGTTAGSAALGGTSVGVTAAATTGSGVTNQRWELTLRLTCLVGGIGTGLASILMDGQLTSGGLASPFVYAMAPTTPPTATWTAVLDGSQTYYGNLSVTCSNNSASNTIQCLRHWVTEEM